MKLGWLVQRPTSWRGEAMVVLAVGAGMFAGGLLFGDWRDGLVYAAIAVGTGGLTSAYRYKRPGRPRGREVEVFDEGFGGSYEG